MSPPPRVDLILWLFSRSWSGVLQLQVARQAGRIEELVEQYADIVVELESERAERRQAELRALVAERALADRTRFTARRRQVR